MAVAIKILEHDNEIGLAWFLEKSSLDPFCSVLTVAGSIEVDWTGLTPLDILFPRCWEPCRVFKSAEGHTTELR